MITLTIGKHLFELLITQRQRQVLCRPNPPLVLARYLNKDRFQKSQAYGLAKAKFRQASGLYYAAVQVLSLRANFLAKIWHLSGQIRLQCAPSWCSGHISQSVLFAVLYIASEMVQSLPIQLWEIFILEERFGFNKQSLRLFLSDQAKTLLITSTILVPTVLAFLAIINATGDYFAIYLGIAALGIRAFVMTIHPVVIVPLFFKLSPLEDQSLKSNLMAVCDKLSFPLTKVYVVDGSSRTSHSNAFFFGFPWQKNIVIFDTLLQQMGVNEIVAVIAHELGHWSLGHTARLFIISQVSFLLLLGYLISKGLD